MGAPASLRDTRDGDRMSRIVMVTPGGGDTGYAIFLGRGLELLGHAVSRFALSAMPEHPSLPERLRHRLRRALTPPGLARRRIEEGLVRFVRSSRPDLVILVKGGGLRAEALAQVRAEGARLVLILPDSPLVDPGMADRAFLDALPQFDLVVTFARAFVPVLHQMGALRVRRIPFAYEPTIHRPGALAGEDAPRYRSPLAYLGSWGPLQERWLTPLVPFGLKIWGDGWYRLPPRHPLRECVQGQGGRGAGFGQAVAGADLVVNFIRAEHGCAHSMKTFEVPACSKLHLVNRTEEQQEFFAEGREAVYFDTPDELRDAVRYYLDHEQARRAIEERALQAVQPHTYQARAAELLEHLRQPGNGSASLPERSR